MISQQAWICQPVFKLQPDLTQRGQKTLAVGIMQEDRLTAARRDLPGDKALPDVGPSTSAPRPSTSQRQLVNNIGNSATDWDGSGRPIICHIIAPRLGYGRRVAAVALLDHPHSIIHVVD